MRVPQLSTLIRSASIVANATSRYLPHHYNTSGLLALSTSRLSLTANSNHMPFSFSSLFGTSTPASQKMSYPVQKSDQEWQAILTPEQFRILRQKGTERPGSSEYDERHKPAPGTTYNCAGCDAPLYKAEHKFESFCGWPAYFDAIPGAVKRFEDNNFGMARTEIVCANCGGHLGHVFKGEGYKNPTNERHCVNGVSIRFSEDEKVSKA